MVEHGQGPRSGSRDNGLRCAGYVAVGDLDPRLADSVLDTLRAEGIAAYVMPTPGARGGYLEVHLPANLTNRLYADSTHVARATEVLAEEHGSVIGDEAMPGSVHSAPESAAPVTPGSGVDAGADQPSPEIDFDTAWQQLLGSLQSTASSTARPWPASEEVESGAFAAPGAGTLDEDPMLDEHFVPPPPPPLPQLRQVTILAWLAILGGLAVIITGVQGGAWFWPGLLAVFAGAGTLIWHVKDGPAIDSGDDDGAIV